MKSDTRFSSINDFYKKLSKNAPLNNNLNNIKTKYPYKSLLILSLINTYKDNIFSNLPLSLSNEIFLKSFYDFITNDVDLFEILSKQKSKLEWGLGFTNKNKKNILKLIKEMPLKKIESKWIKILDNDFIVLNFDIKKEEIMDALNYLEKLCYFNLKKCIPWYIDKTNLEIQNYKENLLTQFYIEGDSNQNYRRPLQHIFRKEVLDRDKKCLVCCADNYIILEACHIKPYIHCENNEKYDLNNGIALCRNHHKLFDSGCFGFNSNLKLLVSRHFEFDDNMYFRQYENCWGSIDKSLSIQKYLVHHYNHIFEKN